MDLELGFAATERGQHAEGDELALCMGEAGAGIDLAEAVGDDVVGQSWCDVGQGVDDLLPAFAVDGGEDLRAAVVAGLLDGGAERALLADVLARVGRPCVIYRALGSGAWPR